MKTIKLIVLLVCPLFGYGQNLTDTSKIFATINSTCNAGDMSGYKMCMFENQFPISNNSKLVITGAYKCIEFNTTLVSLCENDTEYFVNSDYVNFSNDTILKQILNFTEIQKNNFRKNAIQYYKNQRKLDLLNIEIERKLDSIKYEIEKVKAINDAKKFVAQSKLKGLILMDYSAYDESEYTDGTSMKFSFINPTEKTIKYIWINVIGLNAVNDPVVESGKSLKTLKLIGPIKPKDNGEYEVKYVWLSDIVESCKIKSIKIEYMDGTFKTITDVNSIIPYKSIIEFIKFN